LVLQVELSANRPNHDCHFSLAAAVQPSVLKHHRKRVGNGGQQCSVMTLAASETALPVNRSAFTVGNALGSCEKRFFLVSQNGLEGKNNKE
jgi:hypothetical protein